MTSIDSEEEGEAHLFACKCGGNATAVSCGARAMPIDSKVVKIKLPKKRKCNSSWVDKDFSYSASDQWGQETMK